MTIDTVDESQRNAARVAGFTYLFALLPAVFAEFYVRGYLIVSDNVAQTALNIVGHELLFRLGIASNLTVFAADVALITALYVILRPVNKILALMAAGWGLIETGILVAVMINDFNLLKVLSGAEYLKVFEPNQLQALARLSIAEHSSTYNVGLVFSGLRGTLFGYLWFKSGFIPKVLATWGVLASFLMGACAFWFIVLPDLANVVPVEIYGGPIFVFEVIMGFWLLLKGLRSTGTSELN